MDRIEIEKYRKNIELIESRLTDDAIKQMSKEELQEYIILLSKIKARLDLLENL